MQHIYASTEHHRSLKLLAVLRGVSVKQVAADAFDEYLERHPPQMPTVLAKSTRAKEDVEADLGLEPGANHASNPFKVP